MVNVEPETRVHAYVYVKPPGPLGVTVVDPEFTVAPPAPDPETLVGDAASVNDAALLLGRNARADMPPYFPRRGILLTSSVLERRGL
jgi:hypothetical protein